MGCASSIKPVISAPADLKQLCPLPAKFKGGDMADLVSYTVYIKQLYKECSDRQAALGKVY